MDSEWGSGVGTEWSRRTARPAGFEARVPPSPGVAASARQVQEIAAEQCSLLGVRQTRAAGLPHRVPRSTPYAMPASSLGAKLEYHR